MHQPNRYSAKIKRCSRIVILPDYQGIGLGTRFLNVVADYYVSRGFRFHIKTSAKNMIYALKKDERWALRSYGTTTKTSKKCKIDYNRVSLRTNCKTAMFTRKPTVV